MQFLNTNAADLNALLIEIRDFLSANGWTTLADGTGGGGLTLEMTNGNGHDFSLAGTKTTTPTEYNVGVFTDRYCEIKFQKSDIGLAAGYSATPAETNDCQGPFANVWLVTDDDATYCVCVLQTGSSRYNHFAFGDIDAKGVHAFDVPFCMGMFWKYWRDTLAYETGGDSFSTNVFNNPGADFHKVGMFAEDTPNGKALRVGVPDGIVDPTLGFTDGPLDLPILTLLSNRYYVANIPGSGPPARLLDYFIHAENRSSSGGVPIFPLPIMVQSTPNVAHTYIGDIPGIGLVNMTGLSAGQVLDFAGEEWLVFPLKQFGLVTAAQNGTTPLPICNSLNYGIAVKKTDAP